jgi:hypothetical protein
VRRATLSLFEIPATDVERSAAFFRAVLGWDAVEVAWDGPRYLRLLPPEAAERPGGGILERGPRAGRGAPLVDRLTVMIRIEGEPLEAVLERVVRAGGAVALAPTAIGDFGRYARFDDPDGNGFGLWSELPPS